MLHEIVSLTQSGHIIEQTSSYLTINHKFDANWKLTAIGSIQNTEVKGFGVGVPTAIATNGDYTRTLSAVHTRERIIQLKLI
jgi:iron complex outermembrane receptor protein